MKVRPIRIRLTNRVEKVNGIFISGRHQGTFFENKQLCFIEGKTHCVLDATIPICKHNTDRMTCLFSVVCKTSNFIMQPTFLPRKERGRKVDKEKNYLLCIGKGYHSLFCCTHVWQLSIGEHLVVSVGGLQLYPSVGRH